jgi:hypothetical protein
VTSSIGTAAFVTPLVVNGPPRSPRQLLADQAYGGHQSVHDDATARRLGFAGAAIEGPTHLTQFEPLAHLIWGTSFYEQGCLSTHFEHPAYDGDRLVAALEVSSSSASDGRLALVKEDGTSVLVGTAHLGAPQSATEIEQRLASRRRLAAPRILSSIDGDTLGGDEDAVIEATAHLGSMYPFSLADKLEVMTEVAEWHRSDRNPWGRRILPFEMINVLCYRTSNQWLPIPERAVGLFVHLEVQMTSGPVFVGHPYRLERRILGLGESWRTESFWLETCVRDRDSGLLVARVVLHTAILKDSVSQPEDTGDRPAHSHHENGANHGT